MKFKILALLCILSNTFCINTDLEYAIKKSRIKDLYKALKNIDINDTELKQALGYADEILKYRKKKYERNSSKGIKHKEFITGDLTEIIATLSFLGIIASWQPLTEGFEYFGHCAVLSGISLLSYKYFATKCRKIRDKEWEDRNMRTYKQAYLDALDVQQFLIKYSKI